jgi:hypothetical protein
MILYSNLFGIEIVIKKGTQSAQIHSFNLRGIEYIPTHQLAKILGANYYFNEEKQKSEIKFINYNLKFTANNQFVILTE